MLCTSPTRCRWLAMSANRGSNTMRWLRRVLKMYLLTLAWILFVAILYFALQAPVTKVDCQMKCFDEVCHSLVHLGCSPVLRAESTEHINSDDDSPPTRRPRLNFIELLLSNLDYLDENESPVLLLPDAVHRPHESPTTKPESLTFQKSSKTVRSDGQTTIATISSSQSKEFFPLNTRSGIGHLGEETGGENTRRLDDATFDAWTEKDVEWKNDDKSQQSNSVSLSLSEETHSPSPYISLDATSSPTSGETSASVSSINAITIRLPSNTLSPGSGVDVTKGNKPEGTGSTKADCSKVHEHDKLCPYSLKSYYDDERKRCAKQDLAAVKANASEYKNIGKLGGLRDNATTNSWKFCPCIPPNLVGRLGLVMSSAFHLEELWELKHRDVEPGGEWKPPDCLARTRLALVVPYRDRLDHLKIFLLHMLPVLKRQLVHFRIFIVEQNEPAVFNKAAMMNIGFLEAMKQFQFDCVLFHDVDILMEDDRSLLNCGDAPHHYAISLDRWHYRLKYETVFGAVITLRPDMFNRTNGFSNSYFGWGGEDDDMSRRVRRFWKIYRPPMEVGRYTAIKHVRDTANKVNKNRINVLRRQLTKMKTNGLNSIRYDLVKIEKLPLFTWIVANLDVSDLPYPVHASSNYTLSNNTCLDDEAKTTVRQRSWVTCKYDCDLKGPSCFGFNHRVDGFSRDCWLITGNCSTVGPAEHLPGSVQTYLKHWSNTVRRRRRRRRER